MRWREISMDKVVIRKAGPEDSEHFSQLVLIAVPELLPYFFGSNTKDILKNLFQDTGNFWSYEHTYFVEVDGDIAGMALGYGHRQRKQEEERTGELIVKYLEGSTHEELPNPRLAEITEKIEENEYYFMYLAVYPEFRRRGIGTKLFALIEEEAGKTGYNKVVFDVETDNKEAIKLYERLGYSIVNRSPVVETSVKNFEFFKMGKDI
jgi:ribosomal protein S18 acetylase RimI-like enzyme